VTLDHDFDEIADCQRFPRRQSAMETVVERAKVMLAVSQRMEQDMRRLLPKAMVSTHPIGVDLLSPDVLQRDRPPELQNKQVVLACALFAERKGIPLLVEAFGQVLTQQPQAILRIIGAGAEEETIRGVITRLKLENHVQLLGKKLHSEVLQEMAWADCFALVGWDEPLGAVYLEAMAAGKPIVCCNDGGINDLFLNGKHGYAVPPRDVAAAAGAIVTLLSQPLKCIEMGQQAQQWVKQSLTWDIRAVELLNIFERAIAQPSSSVDSI
jgi:glycosyltransferase involved in cell wall biosynthesis